MDQSKRGGCDGRAVIIRIEYRYIRRTSKDLHLYMGHQIILIHGRGIWGILTFGKGKDSDSDGASQHFYGATEGGISASERRTVMDTAISLPICWGVGRRYKYQAADLMAVWYLGTNSSKLAFQIRLGRRDSSHTCRRWIHK